MRRWLILLGVISQLAGGAAAALTISGQVSVGGAPLAGAVVMGPKAVCTASDFAGNYSCAVAAGWTGTLAAYLDGYAFSPATREFAALGANQTGQNFGGVRAAGLRADVAIFRKSIGRFFIDVNGDSVPDIQPYFGAGTSVPLAGDLDGNGVADLVVYGNGLWFVDYNLDGGIGDQVFALGGVAGDVPLLCDFNGDGTDDLVIYRGGKWFVSTKHNGVVDIRFDFGLPGDIPLCGDINGDGVADLVVYRNGVWFIDTNRDGAADIVLVYGGLAGDIPLVFDYDGDGHADLAIYRNGIWLVNTQLDGTVQTVFTFGGVGDVPLAGHFNRANTLFVKAGSPCSLGCTMANPYGTITSAWQDAPPGAIVRIAAGTYPENLAIYYPGVNYAPGKFGKNDIKLLGVSRNSVVVAPPSGDALAAQGATGYVVRGMRFTGGAGSGRGLVLIGGPGSVSPGFPGPQFSLQQVDVVDSGSTNVLLTGTSNVRIRDSRINRSRTGHGMSLWQASYARVRDGEILQNGYTVPAGPPLPDAGKGLDVRQDSEIDARRNVIRANLTLGVSGVDRSVVRLTSNAIDGSGYDGIIIGGANPNDTTTAYITGNWIAGNGTVPSPDGWNGIEFYISSIGAHQVTSNFFVANSANGLFIGSGTVTITGNYFQGNRVGVFGYSGASSTDTTMSVYANTFDSNTVEGLFAERELTATKKIIATIGGTGTGQPNLFRNIQPPAFFAIACYNIIQPTFVCPSGGNTFVNNVRDIDTGNCPATCVK